MKGARVIALMFFGVACGLVFLTPATPIEHSLGDPGPALLPRMTGIAMGLLAIGLFFRAGGDAEPDPENRERGIVVLLSLLAIPIFYFLFEQLGFTAAVAIYLFLSFAILGQHNRPAMLRYALASVAFSLVSSLLFGRLLDIPMPGLFP